MSRSPKSDSAALRDPQIRAVSRVLHLLRVMNTRHVWSLHALHQETGLAKSTLSRLLLTLQAEGYARAEEPAGTWCLTRKVQELDAGLTEGHDLVDLARPQLLATTRRIKWPLALGLLDVDAIVVRFSSMPYSPLAVHTTTLGHRLSLVESAMGRAFLAFCAETTREVLLTQLGQGLPQWPRWPKGWIEHDLAQVRRTGYAVRQPSAERGTATLAVPLLVGGEARAVLGMTTFGSLMTEATVNRHVPLLQEVATKVAELVSRSTDAAQ